MDFTAGSWRRAPYIHISSRGAPGSHSRGTAAGHTNIARVYHASGPRPRDFSILILFLTSTRPRASDSSALNHAAVYSPTSRADVYPSRFCNITTDFRRLRPYSLCSSFHGCHDVYLSLLGMTLEIFSFLVFFFVGFSIAPSARAEKSEEPLDSSSKCNNPG